MALRDHTATLTGGEAGGDAHPLLSRTLGSLAGSAAAVRGVRERDLRPGDWLLVRTRNSLYVLGALGDGDFQVTGGWFAAHAADGSRVRVNGCTWGGHAILTGIVAAAGMCLEFDNGVQTTRIRELSLLRGGEDVRH